MEKNTPTRKRRVSSSGVKKKGGAGVVRTLVLETPKEDLSVVRSVPDCLDGILEMEKFQGLTSDFRIASVLTPPWGKDAIRNRDLFLGKIDNSQFFQYYGYNWIKDIVPLKNTEISLREGLDGINGRLTTCNGSDPEMFGVNKKGLMVPAFEVLKGVKKEEVWKEMIETSRVAQTSGCVYPDGFAFEVLTKGFGCLEQFLDALFYGISQAQSALMKQKARLTLRNCFEVSPEVLEAAPFEMSQLGCAQSFSAYEESPLSIDGRMVPIRTAGGHMHFSASWGKKTWIPMAAQVVKTMDCLLGLMGVCMADGWDDPRRRTYYGKAGEYRLPAHGLEYRVLSNFWLVHPQVTNIVWEFARLNVSLGLLGDVRRILPMSDEEVRTAINYSDGKLARVLLARIKPLVMVLIEKMPPVVNFKTLGVKGVPEKVWKILTTPILQTVKEVENFWENWTKWKVFATGENTTMRASDYLNGKAEQI